MTNEHENQFLENRKYIFPVIMQTHTLTCVNFCVDSFLSAAQIKKKLSQSLKIFRFIQTPFYQND